MSWVSLVTVNANTNSISRESGNCIVISWEFPGNILPNKLKIIRKYKKVGNWKFSGFPADFLGDRKKLISREFQEKRERENPAKKP
jgi:hypothetical protein